MVAFTITRPPASIFALFLGGSLGASITESAASSAASISFSSSKSTTCTSEATATQAYRAPHYVPDVPEHHRLEGWHIVHFNDDHTLEKHISAIGRDVTLEVEDFVHVESLPGYYGKFNDSLLHDFVRTDPGIDHVEQDSMIEYDDEEEEEEEEEETPEEEVENPLSAGNYTSSEIGPEENSDIRKRGRTADTQDVANWGPASISMRGPEPPNGFPIQDREYPYRYWDDNDYVDAYVVNSGVKINHYEFAERQGDGHRASHFGPMIRISRASRRQKTRYCSRFSSDNTISDTGGHGTHVAGILGGLESGATKDVQLINVKISCNGHSSTSGMEHALSDIINTHRTKMNRAPPWEYFQGSVINMSLLIRHSSGLSRLFQRARTYGIPIAVGVKNENRETFAWMCDYPGIVCVSGIDQNYRKRARASYGRRVRIVAPSDNIRSAGISSRSAFTRKNGNSMASPFVAGVMAQIIGIYDYDRHVDEITDILDEWAFRNAVTGFPRYTPPLLNNLGRNNREAAGDLDDRRGRSRQRHGGSRDDHRGGRSEGRQGGGGGGGSRDDRGRSGGRSGGGSGRSGGVRPVRGW